MPTYNMKKLTWRKKILILLKSNKILNIKYNHYNIKNVILFVYRYLHHILNIVKKLKYEVCVNIHGEVFRGPG